MPRQTELFEGGYAREVIEVPVTKELGESFMAYSLSVITSRAIPDVRDGLKPVQRRILHAMADMGMRPDRPHRKCANVVGETMGKYHPHGDGAIYDALVRMGQSFGRNITLVDPHGNFGSLDDPPAAYRYTECRLTEAAMEMLAEIDEETVEFRPTFDGERSEPTYLPARLPNLLVNGTSGIAVGMATNMAPHNLVEVFEAIKLVMTKRRPKPTTAELMAALPGPDFPSGGVIVDDGLAEAYETGRGSVRVRATAEVVDLTRARQGIVVTELPYLVGPERVVGRIQELMRNGKLPLVTDVKNTSDRHTGLRIEIELRPGANARAVLTELYRLTPMEDTFGINNVVLVDGTPRTLGLYDLCQHYIDHRLDVVRRRTEFRLEKARRRLHLVEGLLIALDAIDLVVSIIRSSEDAAEARDRLMAELSLTEVQAVHILDMQLRRLTALAKLELEAEAGELRGRIDDFEKILASDRRQRTIVLSELEEMVGNYGTERRSRIVSPDALDDVTLEEAEAEEAANRTEEPCVVALSTTGMIGQEPVSGPRPATPGRHDVIAQRVATTTHSRLAAVTSRGRVFPLSVATIPEVTGRSRGVALGELVPLDKGEEVLTLVAAGAGPDGDAPPVLLVTAQGVMKRVAATDLLGVTAGRVAIKLKPQDRVVAATLAADGTDVVAVGSNAQVLRCEAASVPVQGPGAGGVAGMKLSDGAVVVGAGIAGPGAVVLTVSDSQTAKVTDAAELPTKGRNTGGLRITKFRNEKRLEWAYVGTDVGVLVVVGTEDAPSKPDPTPETLTLHATGRDLASKATKRRWLGVGTGRW
ncbi:MAG TPA: DNA topoisomerase 4 subunit A [Microthrixaceae bacterium]|nr:DNA topoisomerase 4 subunit A [Microthrixaceae bacterium]HMX08058.1 DNA topoisomerase 4 subunit A [Microthrixaceae bacterium]HMX64054.1 DNA topoisomerase 4 subunit A [Microthrixaceae bacterium]HMY86904.1 DNA topoisomerase 4 subunit A [Microthrixaceae bacterium]HNA35631.1 DNA topoisomerase 4 subunit A [Microthrixaceae bacterium]